MFSISFGSLILALILADVTSWTIDLPEARKFLFEKNDRLEKRRYDDEGISEQILMSNRCDSNSKHHEHQSHKDPYAKDYGYQSYTEKKVRDIVHDGSEYLGGLQRSIENFTELLENCTRSRVNQTITRYRFNETAFNATAFMTAPYNFSSPNSSTPSPWRPINEIAFNETNFLNSTEQCRRVTRASEHVRRLAELATKATKDLQDIAYSRRYMKDDPHDLSKEENELILKLAWFLDRLAYYTDFHPQPKRFLNEDYTTTTTSPPPSPSMVNASEATKLMMMNCLKQNSTIPATIRCAYPEEIPSIVPFSINNSNPLPAETPSSSNRQERVVQPAMSEQELLIATDDRPYHHLTTVRHVKKRSIPEVQVSKDKKEDPAINFLKYFVKHKVWEGSNPEGNQKTAFQLFEVSNKLHRIQKREVGKKLELPEDPFQDLSKYAKTKKGVSYVKDEVHAQKIRAYIEKIRNSKPSTAKEHSRRITKLFRSKRAFYETDVDKPRDPDDLFKDISYYVKNRQGTNYNADVLQAGQLRGGLNQIFLNPNIETVRRYGANFNPLIQDPLLFAAMRSAADNL